jgi:hypothetical protein
VHRSEGRDVSVLVPPRPRNAADEPLDPGSAALRSRPRLWTWVLLLLAVVAFAVTMMHEHTRLEHTLHRERAALRSADGALTNARRSLIVAQAQTTTARAHTATAKHNTALAIQQKRFIDASITNDGQSLSNVNSQLDQAQTGLFTVAGNVNEVMHCLNGVTAASAADAQGNTAGAVAALNDAASDCAKTAALASGALVPYDFADPYVLDANGTYYAYSTNSGAGNIQVLRSSDLVSWQIVGNGLAHVPGWAQPNGTWAPSVLQRGNTYVAYYTVPDHFRRRCVSRAVAPSPAGPFVDDSTGPLVCDGAPGGAIDPSPFVDPSGKAYLVWKAQSNPPVIWSQQLSDDGLSFVGTSNALLGVSESFEHGVVEAPSMFTSGGQYFLVYSAGDWQDASYNTAYATCAGPSGPCTKPANNQILVSGSQMVGPGGAEAFRASDGHLYVAFHAYSPSAVGYPANRYLHIARLFVNGSRLTVDAQT